MSISDVSQLRFFLSFPPPHRGACMQHRCLSKAECVLPFTIAPIGEMEPGVP